MVTVSLDGLFAPALDRGLARGELDEILHELEATQRSLMERRGRDAGFYDVGRDPEVVEALEGEGKRLRSLASDLLVLGIGASSLGAQAIAHALAATSDYDAHLHFFDNTDPDAIGDRLERLDPARTAAVVVSKSGGSVETLAQFLIVRRWFRASLGQGESRPRFVFVTDPEHGLLRELGAAEGIRTFDVPSNVAPRFTALTPVGLLPAAFLGIDVDALLAGAEEMAAQVTSAPDAENPAIQLAAGALLAQRRRGATSIVLRGYADALRLLGGWFGHLWAGCLGRDVEGAERGGRRRPTTARGAKDVPATVPLTADARRDEVVVMVSPRSFRRPLPIPDELRERPELAFLHGCDLAELLAAERRATRAALLEAGVPVIEVELNVVDAPAMGALLMLLQAACALVGTARGIDPFDPPGVETGHRMALGLMGHPEYQADADRVRRRETR